MGGFLYNNEDEKGSIMLNVVVILFVVMILFVSSNYKKIQKKILFISKEKIENCIYKNDCYKCQITLNKEYIGDIFFSKENIKYIIFKKKIAKGNFNVNNIEKDVVYDGKILTIKHKGKKMFSAKSYEDDVKKIMDIL